MTARRLAGWLGLAAAVGLALAVIASVGPRPAAVVPGDACAQPACLASTHLPAVRPTHSPRPSGETATPEPTNAAPATTAAPTLSGTDAPSLSPDGVGVAGGVSGVQSTPHGLLSVPQEPVSPVAHGGGDLSLVVVLLVILSLVALTSITLAVGLR